MGLRLPGLWILLLAAAAGGAAPATDVAALIADLSSPVAGRAARAEAALAGLGRRATPALAAILASERRDPAACRAILRIFARVKDPEAAGALFAEWGKNAGTRDELIPAWAGLGEAGVSPLASYYAEATLSQKEAIIEALGGIGEPAARALEGIQRQIGPDEGSAAERLHKRIGILLELGPVITLAGKGPVAWRDLEILAGDPGTPLHVAREAIRGLSGLAPSSAEAAEALVRLSGRPISAELRDELAPRADEARLLGLARKGASALGEYAAILGDPASSDRLRMGAIDALYGLGPPALPVLEAAAGKLPAGAVADYLKGLTAALRALPSPGAPAGGGRAAATPPAAGAAAPPVASGPPPAGPTCQADADFGLIATIEARGMTISPRWFRRTTNGRRMAYTTVESGFYRLVLASSDGSDSATAAPLAHQFAPFWSWDSSKLAFLGCRAQVADPIAFNEVYISDPGLKEPRRISATSDRHASPIWLTKQEDVIYAINRLPGDAGFTLPEGYAVLYRYSAPYASQRTLLTLPGRIVTAIEPSPELHGFAFLSWGIDADAAGPLFLHLSDAEAAQPRELQITHAGEAFRAPDGSLRPLSLREALALGGDLTWSSDGSLITVAGRIVDVASWHIVERIDPSGDAYAPRAVSRTLQTADPGCFYFNDTRQLLKRCPPSRSVQILSDCRGALLWRDEERNRMAIFDPLNGGFGLIGLPKPRAPQAPRPARPSTPPRPTPP